MWIYWASITHIVSSLRIILKMYLNFVYAFLNYVCQTLPGNGKSSLLCPGFAEMHLKSVCDKMSYGGKKKKNLPGMHSHSQIHSTPRNLWLSQTEYIHRSLSRLWFVREVYKLEPTNRLGFFAVDFKRSFQKQMVREDSLLCPRTAGSVVFQLWGWGWERKGGLKSP